MASVIILGPAHPLRGGIAAFNERLAQELLEMGHQVTLYSFSLQYPSLLFPGKSQYTSAPSPEDLDIRTKVNAINPLNWLKVGREIKHLKPDLIITRFWLPFMAPSLGTILRRVRKNKHTRVVCIADNVVPHENRPGDKAFTSYMLHSCDAFIVMSGTVLDDLKKRTSKPVERVAHPLYDHFGEKVDKAAARAALKLPADGKLLLFFGFIRRYKGLDLLLEAMGDPRVRELQIRLLVAGEFYENETPYQQLIQKYGLQDALLLHTHFISDEQVHYYFSAADAVVLPYRAATQSGIAPMAYHFERPMLATRVGGLPETIPDGKAGLLCEPDGASLAGAILEFYRLGESYFTPSLLREKQKYSWRTMATTILRLGTEGSGQL
jgi:glycosyltransferase involved in cell wall biosynthesis